MKTLLKILLGLFVLVLLVVGAAYFVVTRPGFQKNLIEQQLPEGSSLKYVQITPRSVELLELKLRLPDGTSVKVERMETAFSPLAAVFKKTLRVRGLEVDGLLVQLPESVASSPTSSPASGTGESAPVESKPAEVISGETFQQASV